MKKRIQMGQIKQIFIIFVIATLLFTQITLTKSSDKFEVTTSQDFGDVNNDARIDLIDALLIFRYYLGYHPASFDPRFADVNLDGKIDTSDVSLVIQYYFGMISEFPANSIPLIEGRWFIRYFDWQDNLVGKEYATIERIGNEIKLFADIHNELLGTGKLLINNLDPPYNRSDYIIKGLDFRGLGVDKIFIYDESNMETELPMCESCNPAIFSRIVTVSGEYQLIPNPPTTDPPFPGLVYGLIADKNYILTNNGRWYWSGNQPDWPGYNPELGEKVEITGYISIKIDLRGNPYYELEVLYISPA